MDERLNTRRGCSFHRVFPQVRWAWVVALGCAAVVGTCDSAARREATVSRQTAPDGKAQAAAAEVPDERT